MATRPVIAVFGASGLIGEAIALRLLRKGRSVIPVARHFSRSQKAKLTGAVETPFADISQADLARLVAELNADILVNCVGVLQSGPRGDMRNAHVTFVERLVGVICNSGRRIMLVHISVPGDDLPDETEFGRTKRLAEGVIRAAGIWHAILRPGFVIAPAAFGGSAMLRCLAFSPFDLPFELASQSFATTDVRDIGATVDWLAQYWHANPEPLGVTWDLMDTSPTTLGGVVQAFRNHFGAPSPFFRARLWMVRLGAVAANVSGTLGWSSPMRTTALLELQRGIAGDPSGWITRTGIRPSSLAEALDRLSSNVQERWFGRLYGLKPLIVGGLSAFWCLSGLIALSVGFEPAIHLLLKQGFPEFLAYAMTLATSFGDIVIGTLIAMRRTTRIGNVAGIALSVAYLAATSVLAPDFWFDPLGPLLKVGPIIVLMFVSLAISEER